VYGEARRLWYGTGSGSDRAPSEKAPLMAPGRYRSRYRTAFLLPGGAATA